MTPTTKALADAAELFAERVGPDPGYIVHTPTGPVNLRDDLLAKIAAARAAEEWKGIETAPKDAGAIIAYSPDCQSMFTVAWGMSEQAWIYFAGGFEIVRYEITHWRPLPAPPEGK